MLVFFIDMLISPLVMSMDDGAQMPLQDNARHRCNSFANDLPAGAAMWLEHWGLARPTKCWRRRSSGWYRRSAVANDWIFARPTKLKMSPRRNKLPSISQRAMSWIGGKGNSNAILPMITVDGIPLFHSGGTHA